MDSLPQGIDSPRLRDRQWWIDFKRSQQRPEAKPALFKTQPRQAHFPAPQLFAASNGTSPFTPHDLGQIRDACRAWEQAGGEPLAALLAHRGQIIFHEAFGQQRDGTPMTLDTRSWIFSFDAAQPFALAPLPEAQYFADLWKDPKDTAEFCGD